MSYILDALRKADAERERGAVPDLHAQLLPPGSPPDDADGAASLPWRWLGLGAGLIALAGLGWLFLGRDAAPPPSAAPLPPAMPATPLAENAPSPTQAQPQVPVAASASASVASAAQVAETAVAPIASGGEPAAAVDKPEPSTKSKPVARSATTPKAEKPATKAPTAVAKAGTEVPKTEAPSRQGGATAPEPKAGATAARSDAPVPATSAAARLPALAELPTELRQMVPPLAIGGSVYSPQATARMVIINGQVFQEGSALGPDLRLEQIRQKTAVLSIRGTRFEVPL